jgi:hypothetical protein
MKSQGAPKTKDAGSASVIEQHLAGEIIWLGFRRNGDGTFVRYHAVTKDGRFSAVDCERNEGLPSFAHDFRAMVAKAIQFNLNPLKRK